VKLIRILFWEFAQNILPVSGFVVALELDQQGRWGLAIGCIVAGGLAGAAAIYLTESRITASHREPIRVLVTNAVMMVALMITLGLYLSAGWSGWQTDLVVGMVVGAGLGAAQSLAAGEPIGIRHCAALAFSLPLVIIGIRVFVRVLPVLACILLVTAFFTVVVTLVDYGDIVADTR
jgi:hypothetical protein